MPRPLVVICAVGLSPCHLGSDTPYLSMLAGEGRAMPMQSCLPAVTTSAQASMLSGCSPQEHGIVGNGWYFRELGEIWLWRQSEALMQVPPIWEQLRVEGRPLRVLKHFWWYAMNSSASHLVTPRPVYHHDGRKSPDCYAAPAELKEVLVRKHGSFPLFHFWGPLASIQSSRWIAESYCSADDFAQPELALVYLPHLDYDLQRYGPSGPHLAHNLRDLDDCVRIVSEHARARGGRVLVVSEYGLEGVSDAIPLNRHLREQGLLAVSCNAAGELLDPGRSQAFALCDHQMAHVYVRDQSLIAQVHQLLSALPGVAAVRGGRERQEWGLDHPRSGDLVCLAEAGCWFTYDYWMSPEGAPDFARCIEIHKKPGYDPRELFFDPQGGRWRAFRALLRKKLGLRYLLDVIPLDTKMVRGSHGRPAASPELGPLVIAPDPDLLHPHMHQQDIAGLIRQLLSE